MESSHSQQQKQDDVGVMEVPEIHGDILMELLDASLAADENAGRHQQQQLDLAADVVDGDSWIGSQESYDIHVRHDCCEDCGLDGGIMLPDFDEYGGALVNGSTAAPYAVFDHDGTLDLEWAAETADDDAMDPFASACAGDWYMDGLVMAMAMEWEVQDGGSGFPFEPCCYGGEAGSGTAEQVYASLLWE